MHLKNVITKPASIAVLFLLAVVLIPTGSLFAETAGEVEYRDMPLFGSRNVIWLFAQLHILFGAFVLGVPIFVIITEIIGVLTKERRYDRLAKEFTNLIVACYNMTATIGILFLFALLVFYPKLMSVMAGIFQPAYYVYVALFIGETLAIYLYWSLWDKMQNRKWAHISIGMVLNVFGFLIMCLPSGFLSYQASPVVISPDLGPWERAWFALNNPTWWPVNIHRILGNVVLGGFVCGAYAAIAYLGATTKEEREHYDWMGYIGNFIGIMGLLPLPFAGYWLMREVYEYSQQMGITLMGGILSWLFILQAVLIGVLFLGANYYFWQGLAYRTSSGEKYKKPILIMLVILVGSFAVWLTPKTLVASVSEMRAMGGSHHPLLGVFGVMSAKLTVVNLMILTTFIGFLLYWRADKLETVVWAKFSRIFQYILFSCAAVGIVAVGVYGYHPDVPASFRVNVLSVSQVMAVIFILVTVTPLTAISLKTAKLTSEMKWGIMPPRSQYALLLNAVFVVLTMSLMGYARSASRVHWHIYGVLEDTSRYGFTPTLGHASVLFVLNTFIFTVMVGLIFWSVSKSVRYQGFSTQYFFLASVFFWAVSLFEPKKKAVALKPQVNMKHIWIGGGVVITFLLMYVLIGFSVPQKVGLPPEKKELDLSLIKSKQDMVTVGQEIFFSKGQCSLCHSIGPGHGRCPNLKGVGARLTREFIYETLTVPDAYIMLDFDVSDPVPFPAKMPIINKAPIGLSEQEMLTVLSFIQSNGGKVTVEPHELEMSGKTAQFTPNHEIDLSKHMDGNTLAN